MYENFDYNFYADRLRDAEKQRKQDELIRIAEGYTRRERGEQQDSLTQRIMWLFNKGSQPKQAANNTQRAAAL